MIDITEVPGLLRLFSFKLAVVFDVFSRAPLAARIFLSEPDGSAIARLFRRTARRFGPPRHLVSDRGSQFTSAAFVETMSRCAVRHRYGAVGRTGSIALIERFFRTLKATAGLRSRPPLLARNLAYSLDQAFEYYLFLRPHTGLGGTTPHETLSGRPPALLDALPPPRGRPGEHLEVAVPFGLRSLGSGTRLPYLLRKAA